MSRLGNPPAPATRVYWPESRWRRPVNPARRIARRVLLLAAVAGLGLLAVTAVALNVKTDGGSLLDFMAGMLVLVVLGLPAAAVIAVLGLRRQARPERPSPWSSKLDTN